MQTKINNIILQSKIGQEANDILRSCVHCGFCSATCPTYQLLGDELDGPRGRIYLIKRLLETDQASKSTQVHLDRCLSCGACETTCPSGVKYRRLLDIGREIVEHKVSRTPLNKIARKILSAVLSNKLLFSLLLRSGQQLRPVLPKKLKKKIPEKQKLSHYRPSKHKRKMILFRGCVHDAIAPEINASTIRVLDKLEISVEEINAVSCCGAVSHHLLDRQKTEDIIRYNIDHLSAQLASGAEAIFTTASACSLMLKDYPTLMMNDNIYHAKALTLTEKVKDIAEIITTESLSTLTFNGNKQRVAFHSPCSLQHGLKILNIIETHLTEIGCELTEVQDPHLCCGSAGTYSLLQSKLSKQLLNNKIVHLNKNNPDIIATANIGCLAHLQSASDIPVKHWISIIDQALV